MSSPSPLVRSFHHDATGTWTHVVVDPATCRAAIVDPVLDFDLPSGRISTASAQRVLEYVATAELGVDWILETHAHADHLSAGTWLRERTRAKLAIGAGIVDVQRTFKGLLDLGDEFVANGAQFDRLFAGGDTFRDEFVANGAQFDRLFAGGDTFRIGTLDARALATPGHTPDSVSYVAGDAVFVGDTVFAPQAGTARCDFPGGDAAALYRSIRALYALADETRVFLCHDYPAKDAAPVAQTSIADEKHANAHLQATTPEADFVALRTRRDATLAVPKLLWPAIQFNMRGGRLERTDGHAYLKLPVAFDDG